MEPDLPHRVDRRARSRSPGSGARHAVGVLVAALLLGATAGTLSAQPAAAVPAASPVGASAAGAAAPVARTGAQRVDAVEVELVADRAAVVPGARLELALRIRHDPHWHTYWRNPGDSGLPTQIAPVGPPGARFGPIRWPAPERLWVGPLANYGYEGEIVLPFAVDVPSDLAGPRARFEAGAQWLVCKDVCIPGEARVAIELRGQARVAGIAPVRVPVRVVPDAQPELEPTAWNGGRAIGDQLDLDRVDTLCAGTRDRRGRAGRERTGRDGAGRGCGRRPGGRLGGHGAGRRAEQPRRRERGRLTASP